MSGKVRTGGRTFAQISVANNVPLIASGLVAPGTNASAGYVNGGNQAVVTSASNSVNTNPQQFTVGDTSAGGRPLNGLLGEAITYNRKLTDAERVQVESYLALKYGITLANGVDYLNSAGTTLWNATTNSGYQNDIAGVGVDDGSGLSQLASRSVNADSIVTITGTVSNFTSGKFLLWGNDNGATTASTEVPNGYSQRLTREWKVAETGDTGGVTVSFDLTGISGVDLNNPAGFALLIDGDGNFSDATATTGATVNGNTVTFTGVDFGDGQFFSLAFPTPPTPGGVSSNLDLWLRADAGVTESGGQVSQWDDQSGNGFNATQGTAANQPLLTNAALNNNPTISFDNVNDFFHLNQPAPFVGTNDFTVLAVFQTDGPNTNPLLGPNNVDNAFYINATGAFFILRSNISTILQSTTPANNNVPHLGRTARAANNFTVHMDSKLDGTATNSFSFPNAAGRFIGRATRNNTDHDYYKGDIAELVIYSRALNASEAQQVESYLGLKYGITLADTQGISYTTSSGGIVWNATANSAYHNDVAGVGVDDGSGLSQLASRSVNADSIVAITGTVANISDGEFLIWGNDNGATTFQGLGTVSGVATANNRLGRIWKAQETGDVGSVTVEFDSAAVQTGETYCLLVDDDGNFTNGGTVQVGCVVAASPVSFSHDFNTGSAPFFTLGTVVPGTVGGTVFDDADANGTLDSGESGHSGVAVSLLSAGSDGILGTGDDSTEAGTTTDASGVYTFTAVAAGSYRVVAANPANTTSVTPDDVTVVVPLGVSVTVNFADVAASAIVGRVFADTDGNGLFDAGADSGLSGVSVEYFSAGADGLLGTADDVSVNSATTDSNGQYSFTSVGAGSFLVVETDPSGYVSVTSNRVDVVLGATGAAVANFADIQTGTVSGRVFADANGNGRQDAGESALSGVAIALNTPGGDGIFGNGDDANAANTTTGADGSYSFTGVTPGAYAVVETDPSGYESVTPNQVEISIASGGSATASFGDQEVQTVSGTLFDDRNGDGVHGQNESGLAGVSVQLISVGADQIAASSDDSLVATITTDSRGNYKFSTVAAGVYLVTHQGASGFVNNGQPDALVTVTTNGSATASFGLQATGSIKGAVFSDSNGNRERDTNEAGLDSVTIQLINFGADNEAETEDDTLVAATTTNSRGEYSFSGVISNTYIVSITVPAGYQTSLNAQFVQVESGEAGGANFPLVMTGSIYGTVYNDRDGNGQADSGETGMGQVSVSLISAGDDGIVGSGDDSVLASQLTGLDGGYRFTGLISGTYSISQTMPGGFVSISGSQRDVELGEGGSRQIDFFNAVVGRIAGRVIDASNQTGIPGVTVQLWAAGADGIPGNGDDTLAATTTTDRLGNYSFADVAVGVYTVRRPGVIAGYETMRRPGTTAAYTDASTPEQQVTILADENGAAVSDAVWFEMQPTATVYGWVVYDRDDSDGASPLDRFIMNAPVSLVQTSPDLVRDTKSGPKGGYIFRNVDTSAQKTVVTLSGSSSTFLRKKGWQQIVFSADRKAYRVDLLLMKPGIQGYLYLDNNGNKIFDAGDQAIDGQMTLFGCKTGQVLKRLSTEDGYYHFPRATNNANYCLHAEAFKKIAPSTWTRTAAVWRVPVLEGRVFNHTLKPLGRTVLISISPYWRNDFVLYQPASRTSIRASKLDTNLIGWRNIASARWVVLRYTRGEWKRLAVIDLRENAVARVRAADSLSLSSASFVDDSRAPSTVSGAVYEERNGNGRFDQGESGLGGVTVTLLGAGSDAILGTGDDTTLLTTSTAADGSYLLSGISQGSYVVRAEAESGFVDSTPNSVVVSVSAEDGGAALDFGRQRADAIVGTLFLDVDGNGVKNVGDQGLPGQTVRLFSAGADGLHGTGDDVAVATAETQTGGDYEFSDVASGVYRVTTDASAETPQLSPANVIVTVGGGQAAIATFAFGDADAISGVVFNDVNRNGRQDNAENTYDNVSISLKGPGADGILGTGDDTTDLTTTTSNGLYTFYAVPAGSYLIERDSVGTLVAVGPSQVAATLGVSGTVYAHFPLHGGNVIHGTVYNDQNSDGQWNGGERGLEGVEVSLLASGADSLLGTVDDELVLTTTTGINGYYLFATDPITGAGVTDGPLPGGSYLVRQTDLSGFRSTTPNDLIVHYVSGGVVLAEFGDLPSGQLSGVVFDDANGNGRQDHNESGLPGSTVAAKNVAGATVATATTGADGRYHFSALAVLTYTVEATAPGGYAIASPNPVSFAVGGSQQHAVSFAAQPANSLRGVVYHDQDGNGRQDPGEAGLGGVVVQLGDGGPTATTRSDGSFEFTHVAPGSSQLFQTVAGEFVAVDQFVPVTFPANGALQLSLRQRVNGQVVGRLLADANGSGQADGNEQGLAGVSVSLTSPARATAASTTTDANGYYRFSGVGAGQHSLSVGAVDGFVAVSSTVGVNLTDAGQQNLRFLPAETVAGRVFVDANQNGALDENEGGIGGVTVELLTAGADGILNTGDDVVARSAGTTVNGDYAFAGVAPGDYLVRQTDASGYTSTTSNQAPVTLAADGAAQVLFGDRLEDGSALRVARSVTSGATLDFAPLRATFEVTSTGNCLTGVEVVWHSDPHPNEDASLVLLDGYWAIEPVGCTSGFGGTLTLGTPQTLTGNEYLCRFTGTGWDCNITARNPSNGTLSREGVGGFSNWAIGKPVPTGATLASFQPSREPGTTLAWETLNESGLSGFHIWRGTAAAAETRLTDALIGATGGLTGGEYTWRDSVAFGWGERVWYWLEAVNADGSSSFTGPVEVWGLGKLFLPAIGR